MQLIKRVPSNMVFLNEVEKHERAWGSESYTGRPRLDQILSAKVVAFWYPSGADEDMHTTITLHKNMDEISSYVTHLVWHTTKHRLPLVRLARVFQNQHEVKIKSVKIM